MIEDELKHEHSHVTYQDYQNQHNNKKTSDSIAIFVSAFFILLLLFLGIAKQLSPDVDVTIANDSDNTNIEEKSVIDERLKLLQLEDGIKSGESEEMFADELEEKVVIPEHKESKKETVEENNNEKEKPVKTEAEATPKPEETASPAPKIQVLTPIPQPEKVTASKVVVGYYNTREQAEVAKGIIEESGLNISPFVRSIGGAYTIQVGSYSSRDKAQSVVNDLVRNNYPARIISE